MTKEQSAKIVSDLRQKIEDVLKSIEHVDPYDIDDSDDYNEFEDLRDWLLKAVGRYDWTQDNDE